MRSFGNVFILSALAASAFPGLGVGLALRNTLADRHRPYHTGQAKSCRAARRRPQPGPRPALALPRPWPAYGRDSNPAPRDFLFRNGKPPWTLL